MSLSPLKSFRDFIPPELAGHLDRPLLSVSPVHFLPLARYTLASLAAFCGSFFLQSVRICHPAACSVSSVLLVPVMPHLPGLYKGHIFGKAFSDHAS